MRGVWFSVVIAIGLSGVLAATICDSREIESNDGFETATQLTPGTVTRGVIHNSTDTDYFAVVVCGNGRVAVTLTFSHEEGDLDLELYDTMRQQVDNSLSATDQKHLSSVNGMNTTAVFYARVFGSSVGTGNYTIRADVTECGLTLDCTSAASRQRIVSLGIKEVADVRNCCCDEFYGIRRVNGSVTVRGIETTMKFGDVMEVTGDVTALRGNLRSVDFGGLTSVGGKLWLFNNHLTSVEFGGLSSVGGDLWLLNNQLTSIEFGGLTSVGGDLLLFNNHLTSVDFGKITSVGGDVGLHDSSLTSVDFGGLTSVGGELWLSNNQLSTVDFGGITSVVSDLRLFGNQLTSIEFGKITRVGGWLNLFNNQLTIVDFGKITSVGGLELSNNQLSTVDFGGLTSVGGPLSLVNNQLSTVDFGGLTSVGGDLLLHDNQLTAIDFGGLTSVGDTLSLSKNQLTTVDFGDITSVGGELWLHDNQLTIIDFVKITSVGDTLVLSNNSLTSVDFGGLTSVGGDLWLSNNQLTTIDFGKITSVGGWLSLSNNELTTVDFGGLTSVSGNLLLRNNSLQTVSATSLPANLAGLDLSFNPNLRDLTGNWSALTSLRGLFLHNCDIHIIRPPLSAALRRPDLVFSMGGNPSRCVRALPITPHSTGSGTELLCLCADKHYGRSTCLPVEETHIQIPEIYSCQNGLTLTSNELEDNPFHHDCSDDPGSAAIARNIDIPLRNRRNTTIQVPEVYSMFGRKLAVDQRSDSDLAIALFDSDGTELPPRNEALFIVVRRALGRIPFRALLNQNVGTRFTYDTHGDALPDGVQFDKSEGILYGTPQASGVFRFNVTVREEETRENRTVARAVLTVDPCVDGVCNNGVCVPTQDYTDIDCICNGGFLPPHCNVSDPCHPNPCENGGACTRTDDNNRGFNCTCPTNFHGQNCDILDPCHLNPCQNGGTCSPNIGNATETTSHTCQCPFGFNGDDCADQYIAYIAVPALLLLLAALFWWIRRERLRKAYHVFISYRQATDKHLAAQLAEGLQRVQLDDSTRLVCFWDQQSIFSGEDWQSKFRTGLQRSCLFLPIISNAGTAPIEKVSTFDERPDNVLLEYEIALRLARQKRLGILPLCVSSENDPFDFDTSRFPPGCSKTDSGKPVCKTMEELLKYQAVKVDRDKGIGPAHIGDIMLHFENKVWTKGPHNIPKSQQGLNLKRFWRDDKSVTTDGLARTWSARDKVVGGSSMDSQLGVPLLAYEADARANNWPAEVVEYPESSV